MAASRTDANRAAIVFEGGSRIARCVFAVRQLQQEQRQLLGAPASSNVQVERKLWMSVVDELMADIEAFTNP